MSTFDYSEIADDVAEILAEFGFEISMQRDVVQSVNILTSSVTKGTPITAKYTGIMLPVTQENLKGMDLKFASEDFINEDSKILYLAATNTIAPRQNDKIDIGDGSSWRILSVTKIAPTGLDVLYVAGIRKQ